MNVFKRLLMLAGGGESVPYDYPDKFAFFADQAVVEPSILEVLRPSDRLGDFTVVRASDASYTDSSGVIQIAPDNVARIDYTNGVAELLTEPQSTNLVTYSEPTSPEGTSIGVTYEQYNWGNGLSSCVRYVDNATTRLHYGGTAVVDTEYNVSVYVIMDDGSEPQVNQTETDISDFVLYIADGYRDAAITKTRMIGNIWRVSSTRVALGSVLISNGVVKFTGNSPKGFRIVGLQLEELPYATSYIPTNGSTVTRLQDQITDGGNVNVINSEEGTMFFEGSALFDDTGENRYLSLSDGTENNVINISYNTNGALIQFLINAVGALILSHAQPTVDITTNAKVAVKWKVNDFAIWINGDEVDTVLSGVVPTGLNSVNLSNAIGANYFNSRTKAIKVYDRALTDEELTEITTL